MKAIILAAGLGTRIKPLFPNTPKCLIPVADRPVIDYTLKQLSRFDKKAQIAIIVNSDNYQAIENYVKWAAYPNKINLVVQNHQLGTAAAVLLGLEFLGDTKGTFVAFGDTIVDSDLRDFLLVAKNANKISLMNKKDGGSGACIQFGSLLKVIEEPNPYSYSLGPWYYFLNGFALRQIITTLIAKNDKTMGEFSLTTAINYLLGLKPRLPFEHAYYPTTFDIGSPEGYAKANRHFGGQHDKDISTS